MTTYRKSSMAEVQKVFNDQAYWRRMQEGEFTARIIWLGRPRRKRKSRLRGTRSQTVEYLDGRGNRIALVHQNAYPNGRVRGRPDPITLLHNGVLYDCSSEHR
jgi:hypothetical protein